MNGLMKQVSLAGILAALSVPAFADTYVSESKYNADRIATDTKMNDLNNKVGGFDYRITQNKFMAQSATNKAEAAKSTADKALLVATGLDSKITLANDTANSAMVMADKANETSSLAVDASIEAVTKATNAEHTANQALANSASAVDRSETALNTSQEAISKSTSALNTSQEAISKSDEALAQVATKVDKDEFAANQAAVKEHIADAEKNAVKQSNQYTDEKVSEANTYTDNAVSRVDEAVKAESEARAYDIDKTVKSSNAYTNTQVAAERTEREQAVKNVYDASTYYTDTQVATERDQRIAGDARTLESANQYTNSKFAQLDKRIGKVRNEANAGTASALAASQIPQVETTSRFALGAGLGGYNGQNAVAVGLSARISKRTITKFTVTTDSQHNFGYGAGVSVNW